MTGNCFTAPTFACSARRVQILTRRRWRMRSLSGGSADRSLRTDRSRARATARVAIVVYAYAPTGESGLNLLLTKSVRERLTAIAHEIADKLYQVAPAEWAKVFAQHQELANVQFTAEAPGGPPRGFAPRPDLGRPAGPPAARHGPRTSGHDHRHQEHQRPGLCCLHTC
jgi:hypothetical protein